MKNRNKDEMPEEYTEKNKGTNYTLSTSLRPEMKVLSFPTAATSGVEFRCK